MGAFVEQGDEVFHEGEFLDPARFPVQPERFHQVGQLLPVENHALQDAVHKTLQRGNGQPVLPREGGKFLGVFLRLEALVALADSGLA